MKPSIALFALAGVALAAPAGATKAPLSMLDEMASGAWQLRERGEAPAVQPMCVRSAREFIQLRHRGENCRQTVVADGANEVTVQYTCPGHGYGRTHIRRERDDLIQIDSQGIADGSPYAFAAEGRRIGPCRN